MGARLMSSQHQTAYYWSPTVPVRLLHLQLCSAQGPQVVQSRIPGHLWQRLSMIEGLL
jgi:hypothetical protein